MLRPAVLTLVLVAAPAQEPERPGPHDGLFGIAVCAAGDVDRDGHDDLLVAEGAPSLFGEDAPSAWVLSGRDGSVIHRLGVGLALPVFGRCVERVADVDGDGLHDLALLGHRREDPTSEGATQVEIFSAASGEELRTVRIRGGTWCSSAELRYLGPAGEPGAADVAVATGPSYRSTEEVRGARLFTLSSTTGPAVEQRHHLPDGWQFVETLAAPGDLDGDRWVDLVARVNSEKGIGLAALAPGRAEPLWFAEVAGTTYRDYLCDIGDVDLDGVRDLLLTAVDRETRESTTQLLSGVSGVAVCERRGPEREFREGSVCGLGDLDADGLPDHVVAWLTDGEDLGPGVDVLSGRDDHVLFHWQERTDWFDSQLFGWAVSSAGDVDGDGTEDVAVTSTSPWGPEWQDWLRIYSGRDGSKLLELTNPIFEPVAGEPGDER